MFAPSLTALLPLPEVLCVPCHPLSYSPGRSCCKSPLKIRTIPHVLANWPQLVLEALSHPSLVSSLADWEKTACGDSSGATSFIAKQTVISRFLNFWCLFRNGAIFRLFQIIWKQHFVCALKVCNDILNYIELLHRQYVLLTQSGCCH